MSRTLMIAVALLGACVVEPEPTENTDEGELVSRGDDEASAVSCATVTTCNAAGADGTRCRQTGCSVGAARLECTLESVVVCGTPVCPVIFIHSDGTRENLCGGDRP